MNATSFQRWEVGWWQFWMPWPWLILMNWLYCQAIVTAMSESWRIGHLMMFFLITIKISLLTDLTEKRRNYAKQKSLTCPKHRWKNTFLWCGYNSTHALTGGLFFCNDRILPARCLRHIQSVFNLIVDNDPYGHPCLMVNWQLSKRISADQCHLTALRAKAYDLSGWRVFLKLSADQLLVLIGCWLRS